MCTQTKTEAVGNIKAESIPTVEDDDQSSAAETPIKSNMSHAVKKEDVKEEESDGKLTVAMPSDKDDMDTEKLMDDSLDPISLDDYDPDGLLPESFTSIDFFDNLPLELEILELATTVSHDSSSSNVDDDLSALMKTDIIETPQKPNPYDALISKLDAIGRIMTCLHHNGSAMLRPAEQIVYECQSRHHHGDRRYRDLPGTIFERLVHLFGSDKFKEIYRHSQHYSPPRDFVEQMSTRPSGTVTDPTVPTMLELAVAFGLHMARTEGGTEHGEKMAKLVRRSANSLNSMNDSERCMFWDFMTLKPASD